MTKKILQIIPRLPLFNDGVGDYSVKLSKVLYQNFDILTDFLIFDTQSKIRNLDGYSVRKMSEHNPDAFLSLLPQDIEVIVLQYSNYPYLKNKLKAPFWLVKAFELAVKTRQIRLLVMFHELPVLKWKSINILNPIQSLMTYQLGKVADIRITNNAKFQSTLSRWINKPVICIPNFSNVGELIEIPRLIERKPQMLTFGTTHNRLRLYQKYLKYLLQACKTLGIEEIYDIGQKIDICQDDLQGIRLVQMGKQPSEVVSQMMSTSLAGFLDYSWYPGCLGKSTVFAAFCAHGLVPILTKYNPSEADGIEINKHYLVAKTLPNKMRLEKLQVIADNAHQWYSSHRLIDNAKTFASQIFDL